MIRNLKGLIKERLYTMLGKTYSRTGLPISLLKHLKRKQPIVLVDVGAHDGYFTGALADYCGISRGILIEPIPEKAATLRQVFQNPKYQVFECAISSQSGVANFEINEASLTSSLLKIRKNMPELVSVNIGTSKTIQCNTYTLNDIALQCNINQVDLLKIDVQGAEHLVIIGASKFLDITSMVWTEVSLKALYEGSSTFTEICSLLEQAKFRLMELQPSFSSHDGEILQCDALFKKIGQ